MSRTTDADIAAMIEANHPMVIDVSDEETEPRAKWQTNDTEEDAKQQHVKSGKEKERRCLGASWVNIRN